MYTHTYMINIWDTWINGSFMYKTKSIDLRRPGANMLGSFNIQSTTWSSLFPCYHTLAESIPQVITASFMALSGKYGTWTFYQIRKIAGCACAGNARNIFPDTAGKRSRHAPRHVRDARTELAVSFEVGGGENVPDIPSAWAIRNFTFVVRGPCYDSHNLPHLCHDHFVPDDVMTLIHFPHYRLLLVAGRLSPQEASHAFFSIVCAQPEEAFQNQSSCRCQMATRIKQ